MLGEFISRVLVMILGYAYPAFECFKTLEKNRVDIHELRFWCQYWVIVALLSVCEKFGDTFISWMPLYEELKLAFIIYLWYPKTKGTSYVYETFLRPLVTRHETDIERYLKDMRYRAWDLGLYYWQNCTELGQGAFFDVIQYLLTQSQRLRSGNVAGSSAPERRNKHQHSREGSQPRHPPPPMDFTRPPMDYTPPFESFHAPPTDHVAPDGPPGYPYRRWPPQPSAPPINGSPLSSPKRRWFG